MKDKIILNIHTKTDQLINLTQAMLATATSDNWDEFEVLESQRRTMLELVFNDQAIEESLKLHLTDVIKEIQLIDQDITHLIMQQRDLAAEELRHLRHAQQGNKAYQIAADDPL